MTARAATAIVLAGGRSSRFGGPKLQALLDGRPLLDHVVERVGAVADEVVVALSSGAAGALPPGVVAVRDPEAFGGPLAGLSSALDRSTRDVAIVVGGDMPRLRPAVLEAMLVALDPPVAAVVLGQPGGARPLPLAIRIEPARLAIRATFASGDRSLRALVARLDARELAEEDWRSLDPQGETLVDIDRPGDLERLRGSENAP